MLWKCCIQYASKFGKCSSGQGLKNASFYPNAKEGQCQRMFKLPHDCTHFTTSKVMLKILQTRLQQCMNWELPDVEAVFRKGRGTRGQIASIHWIREKARKFQKRTSTSLTTVKTLTVGITTNCGKFLKRWEYQTTLPISQETCIQVKKQELESDMEQQTGSKLGKE